MFEFLKYYSLILYHSKTFFPFNSYTAEDDGQTTNGPTIQSKSHCLKGGNFKSNFSVCVPLFQKYSSFYLIPIITLDPDQPFVSKLLIIRESRISLKSVTVWEESNCMKIFFFKFVFLIRN